jgi:PhnB protein
MISPAIHLPGYCAEAIALYQKAFDITVNSIDYYRDAPPDSGMTITEAEQNKVMHAELTISGSRVNMSDSNPDDIIFGNMIILNVFLNSSDDVCKAFHVLKEGGKIHVELGPQFFSSMYGSVEDRFGIRWQLIS